MSNSDYSAYRELKPLNYLQPPYKASWFDERLTSIGGTNRFGEPNYRVVWGMDERCYRAGNPQAIKYIGMAENDLGMPAWILEEWWSPERLGSPEDWEASRYEWEDAAQVDVLGEYPSRGIYFMFGGRPLMDAELRPLPLNEVLLSAINGMIKNKFETTPAGQARAYAEIQTKAHREAMRRKEKSQKEGAEAWDRYRTHGARVNRSMTREYSLPRTPAATTNGFAREGSLFVPLSLAKGKIQ